MLKKKIRVSWRKDVKKSSISFTNHEYTVPSGGNVTCLKGSRQRDSREANFNEFRKTIAT